MKRGKAFSIVMATYTGANMIDAAFESLLKQKPPRVSYELVVVIDGPSYELRRKVENAQRIFKGKGIPLVFEQFTQNKGRFKARLAAAKQAKHPYILVVDDRVELPEDFLALVSSMGEEIVMPDVKEKEPSNFVSLTLNRLRRKVYGSSWNANFKPYYIDGSNFDKSPKGATTLWVNRTKFIYACEQVAKSTKAIKNVNDDTRILKILVENNNKIYKTSKLKISYSPRIAARDELAHIYHRGPRFIDYYLHPGTRYFAPLLIFYILTPIIIVVTIVLWPWPLLIVLLASLLGGVLTGIKTSEYLNITLGLWALVLFFGAGLIVGLIKKVVPE